MTYQEYLLEKPNLSPAAQLVFERHFSNEKRKRVRWIKKMRIQILEEGIFSVRQEFLHIKHDKDSGDYKYRGAH